MNIEETKLHAAKIDKTPNFYLSWYQIDSGDLISSELLLVTEEMIRKWFWLLPSDLHLDGLIVRASQRKQLQELVKHTIDLNQFDYFVE